MSRRFAAVLAAFCFSVLLSCAIQAQANIKRWEATETWRVDGSEAGEPFADLRDYVLLENGHLWALDFKDQNIRRYDENGKFLSVVGHKGGGPGEMANANGMAVAANGTVWVNDPQNARMNLYSADGKFMRQISRSAGGFGYRWDGWFNRKNGELVERPIGGKDLVWQRYDMQGKPIGTLPYTRCSAGAAAPDYIRAEKPGGMTASYPFVSGGGLAPNGNDGVWCAAARSSRVALIRTGAVDTITQTTLEIPMIPVGAEERSAEIARIEKLLAKYSTNNFDKSKIAVTKPGIANLHSDQDGRLWVEHTARFNVRSTTLDVFDGKGQHLGRIVLPVKMRGYLPVRARGNLLWLTVLDDDDVPSIVQYRIRN